MHPRNKFWGRVDVKAREGNWKGITPCPWWQKETTLSIYIKCGDSVHLPKAWEFPFLLLSVDIRGTPKTHLKKLYTRRPGLFHLSYFTNFFWENATSPVFKHKSWNHSTITASYQTLFLYSCSSQRWTPPDEIIQNKMVIIIKINYYFTRKSCLNMVRFWVNLSLFFESKLRLTSAINLSKHTERRWCWSTGCNF